jgi:hypothetical protein
VLLDYWIEALWRLALAGKIDALVVASVLLASISVAYYSGVYSPRRDAQLSAEPSLEKERTSADKRTELERVPAIRRGGENSNCTSVRSGSPLEKRMCAAAHPIADASPNCGPPHDIATNVNATSEKTRDRCLEENRSGLQ